MNITTRGWRRTLLTLLAALLLPFASAKAETSGIRANSDPTAVRAIKKLELKLCDLLVRGEWERYAGHLTDDYVRVLPGQIQNKAEVLHEMRASTGKTISMVPEKMQTRIYGDTAIAIIEVKARDRTPDGVVTENHGRATKIFVRRRGEWYLAQLTGSPLR